jgi:hypothetical protein
MFVPWLFRCKGLSRYARAPARRAGSHPFIPPSLPPSLPLSFPLSLYLSLSPYLFLYIYLSLYLSLSLSSLHSKSVLTFLDPLSTLCSEERIRVRASGTGGSRDVIHIFIYIYIYIRGPCPQPCRCFGAVVRRPSLDGRPAGPASASQLTGEAQVGPQSISPRLYFSSSSTLPDARNSSIFILLLKPMPGNLLACRPLVIFSSHGLSVAAAFM